MSQKFLVFALVSCFVHLFLVFCTCFLFCALVSCFVHLFLDLDDMSKYLSNSAEKHVMREGIFTVSAKLQFPAVSAHFEGLGNLLNFKKFLKILKFTSKKLYFRGEYMVEYLSD